MTLEELALQGRPSIYTSMAASISGKLLDIRKSIIKDSLSKFDHAEHRLEFVASIRGIEFINDSRATNVNSAWYAMESLNKPIIWIAGGLDKDNDYSILQGLVQNKVKALICLGKDTSKIRSAFPGLENSIVETSSIQEAVKTAYSIARRHDVVLFSPACPSFDLFEDYEDRGRQFKKAVKML